MGRVVFRFLFRRHLLIFIKQDNLGKTRLFSSFGQVRNIFFRSLLVIPKNICTQAVENMLITGSDNTAIAAKSKSLLYQYITKAYNTIPSWIQCHIAKNVQRPILVLHVLLKNHTVHDVGLQLWAQHSVVCTLQSVYDAGLIFRAWHCNWTQANYQDKSKIWSTKVMVKQSFKNRPIWGDHPNYSNHHLKILYKSKDGSKIKCKIALLTHLYR
jgi:hypothetical protein